MKIYTLFILLIWAAFTIQPDHSLYAQDLDIADLKNKSSQTQISPQLIHKQILSNGMTVLVKEDHTIPKVFIQIWYNVGSKDEKPEEKGIAHFLEHMVFKGTKTLSETDIRNATQMFSGSCGATTNHDYTEYHFNVSTEYWENVIPILADCMQNCTFKNEIINSEIKVVIQELKMRRDNYHLTLTEELLSTIFNDHPYGQLIIGNKKSLLNISGESLHAFYKKHYHPGNATLVVVGDVQASNVFAAAKNHFESIPAQENYTKQEFHHTFDIAKKQVTLYRHVTQPVITCNFVVPGRNKGQIPLLNIINDLLSSHLYKKLINEQKLLTNIETSIWHKFDYSFFQIIFTPKNIEQANDIERIIQDELFNFIQHGIKTEEFARAIKKMKSNFYNLLESLEKQSYVIGLNHLATGDPEFFFTYMQKLDETAKTQTEELINTWLRPAIMHRGTILPIPEHEKTHWTKQQKESDLVDEQIVSKRIRTAPLEPCSYAKTISLKEPSPFSCPESKTYHTKNGIKLLYCHNPASVPKIEVHLCLKANHHYDPINKKGLYHFVIALLNKCTKKHAATQFTDILDSKGVSFYANENTIRFSLLKEDLAFVLETLKEILTEATFESCMIEQVREEIIATIQKKNSINILCNLVRESIYKQHPYGIIETKESITNITEEDIIHFYKNYFSPQEARLAIVGDLSGYDVPALVEEHLDNWIGNKIESISYPSLNPIESQSIIYPMNREQIALGFAQLSVKTTDPDYYTLYLFDQLFGANSASQLFKIREKTGLFYSIWGSFVTYSSNEPGIFSIEALVSLDRLKEAKEAILETILHATENVTEDALKPAKQKLCNAVINNYSNNYNIAATLLYLDFFNLPSNYFFDDYPKKIAAITIEDVKAAVQRVLRDGQLLTVQVGRQSSN